MNTKNLTKTLFENPFSVKVGSYEIGLPERPIDSTPSPHFNTKIYHKNKGLDGFYDLIRQTGCKIVEVPYSFMKSRFGDFAGWRKENTLYVAKNIGKKMLTKAQKTAIAAHEYFAGYNHINSDKKAQEDAVQALSPVGIYPYPLAFAEAKEIDKGLGE